MENNVSNGRQRFRSSQDPASRLPKEVLSGRFVAELDCVKWPPNRHEIFDDVRSGVALTATASNILPKYSIVILPRSTTFRGSHTSNIALEKRCKESNIFYYYN